MSKAAVGPAEMSALESADRARKTGAPTPTKSGAGMANDAGCKSQNSSGWPDSHGRGQSGIDPDALHGESPSLGVASSAFKPRCFQGLGGLWVEGKQIVCFGFAAELKTGATA